MEVRHIARLVGGGPGEMESERRCRPGHGVTGTAGGSVRRELKKCVPLDEAGRGEFRVGRDPRKAARSGLGGGRIDRL